jgi:hypothetical protein
MSDKARIPRDFLILGISLLIASAGLGLGILIGREGKSASSGDAGLWIEQLPKDELPVAMVATSSVTKAVPALAPTPQSKTPALPAAAATPVLSGEVIASKTGILYYLPSCAGAKRIKDANKVTFPTAAAAQAKGYGPSKSCKGL